MVLVNVEMRRNKMKKRKKILNLVLWTSMISTSLLGLNVANASAQTADFTDMPSNHWASSTINEWKNFNVISGVDNNNFAPDQPLTRAQMAQIFTNLMGYNQKLTKDFTDVSPTAWYFDAVQLAANAGTMIGTGENYFSPDENITREQLMAAMAIAFDIQPNATNAGFPDISSVSKWALPYVNAMIAGGYVSGMDGKINPKDSATRAQVITIIDNMVAAYNNQPITYTGDVNGNVILRADGSTLSDAIVYGNLIVAEGIGEGAVTLNNVIITGKLIVRGGGPYSVHINGNSLFIQVDGTKVGSVIAQFKGSVIGTTSVVVAPTKGNTLKYLVSDTAIQKPAVGSPTPGTAYTSGNNISATVGQYLAIYEVDAVGNLVNFFTNELVEDNISTLRVRSGFVNGTTAVFGKPFQGNTLKYTLSGTAIPIPAGGSTTPGIVYNDVEEADPNISVTVGQYLAIYEVDESGKVVHFYTKQLVADDVNMPKVYSGSGIGTTRVIVTPTKGNALKYQLSDSAIPTPAVGSTAPGIAYTSGNDISATVGQYLAMYEVNAAGNVVNSYTKQLVEDEVHIPEVYSSSGMGTIQLSAEPAQGNTLKYQLSGSAIPTPAVGSPAPGIVYTYNDDEQSYPNISATVGQYLAVYEVNTAGNVVNSYTKQLVEDEIHIPEVYSGSGMGTIQFSADPAQGNTLKYQLSDSVIPTPAVGSPAPGIAYAYNDDEQSFPNISATVGQYLAVYEVNAVGNVVNSYTKQLVEDEIQIPEVYSGSGMGTIQFSVDPTPGNTLKYQLSDTAIPTRTVGSTAPGIAYTSGNDISATVGQYLAVYEVNAVGNVVNFYTKQLVEDEINSATADIAD
jgi:hypothetical protein